MIFFLKKNAKNSSLKIAKNKSKKFLSFFSYPKFLTSQFTLPLILTNKKNLNLFFTQIQQKIFREEVDIHQFPTTPINYNNMSVFRSIIKKPSAAVFDVDYNRAVNKTFSSHGNKINEQSNQIFQVNLLLKKLIMMSYKRSNLIRLSHFEFPSRLINDE